MHSNHLWTLGLVFTVSMVCALPFSDSNLSSREVPSQVHITFPVDTELNAKKLGASQDCDEDIIKKGIEALLPSASGALKVRGSPDYGKYIDWTNCRVHEKAVLFYLSVIDGETDGECNHPKQCAGNIYNDGKKLKVSTVPKAGGQPKLLYPASATSRLPITFPTAKELQGMVKDLGAGEQCDEDTITKGIRTLFPPASRALKVQGTPDYGKFIDWTNCRVHEKAVLFYLSVLDGEPDGECNHPKQCAANIYDRGRKLKISTFPKTKLIYMTQG